VLVRKQVEAEAERQREAERDRGQHGMGTGEIGTWLAGIGLVAGGLGTYLGGALSDRLAPRDASATTRSATRCCSSPS
jgi:hypothetical protein